MAAQPIGPNKQSNETAALINLSYVEKQNQQ
jgi:hypothetical protein